MRIVVFRRGQFRLPKQIQTTNMKMDQGLIWESIDKNSALIVFDEGCRLVAHDIHMPRWVVCALPESMSDEIRSREGELKIKEYRDGDDVAIIVTIGSDDLAFCSTPKALKFLVRQPILLFTA